MRPAVTFDMDVALAALKDLSPSLIRQLLNLQQTTPWKVQQTPPSVHYF